MDLTEKVEFYSEQISSQLLISGLCNCAQHQQHSKIKHTRLHLRRKGSIYRHLPSIDCFKPSIQIMKQHIEFTFSELLSRPVNAPADAFFWH